MWINYNNIFMYCNMNEYCDWYKYINESEIRSRTFYLYTFNKMKTSTLVKTKLLKIVLIYIILIQDIILYADNNY